MRPSPSAQAAAFLQHPDLLTREVARNCAQGAFLMDNGDGLEWYSVARRAVVPLTEADGLHIARRFRRELPRFRPSIDLAFEAVLEGCRGYLAGAPERDGEWISDELAAIYLHLHETGLVHSFEVWRGDELAGGVLGLTLGGAFIAESKFHRITGGSKAALFHLAAHLHSRGFGLLDAQIQNPHLETLGVYEISEDEYEERLAGALALNVTL